MSLDQPGPSRFRRDIGALSRDFIFLSYRRSDAGPWVGRLADDLRRHFGQDRVFRDLDSNRPAQDYVEQIDEALSRSRAVLAVVGPTWASASAADGSLRLHDTEDMVRFELERALTTSALVVVVLVGGASPPAVADLPRSLATLGRLHALQLRDTDWRFDMGRLYETLEDHGVVAQQQSDPRVAAGVKQSLTTTKRYQRTLRASRRRAYDAVVGAVELLRYPSPERDPEGARVTFRAARRQVVAKVVDADPGMSRVVVEFGTAGGPAVTSGALVLGVATGGVGLAGWAALRAWERRFAVGFLDNVQNVLEGRGVGEDSSLLPGVEKWRTRSREA